MPKHSRPYVPCTDAFRNNRSCYVHLTPKARALLSRLDAEQTLAELAKEVDAEHARGRVPTFESAVLDAFGALLGFSCVPGGELRLPPAVLP